MRLGIRRKLIGTLMLVGLFPLAMSLVVILGVGASIQLNRIRTAYEDAAAACAEHISDALLHEELEKLVLVTHLPQAVGYVRADFERVKGRLPAATAPKATPEDESLDARWAALPEESPEVQARLKNVVAERLRLLSEIDAHPRQTLVTNAAGELIAADGKTDDYFQADEEWWQKAYDKGRGRLYVSSIERSTGGGSGTGGLIKTGDPVVVVALPIYDTVEGKKTVIGVMRDELAVSWLLKTLHDVPEEKHLNTLTQLIDLNAGKAVYATGGRGAGAAESAIAGDATDTAAMRTETFFFAHRDQLMDRTRPPVHELTLLFNDLVVGASPVELEPKVMAEFPNASVPKWVVVVSKPSAEAMTPVYRLAGMVTAIGAALILVLFILGVAISNREIIMPILRLREATAAVGRGELNVRVVATDTKDSTFRGDELGDLARDFDEMTRQLQKNVNQLARSNEAKRRFMELAGHELRTPVTYLLGVCQLAQKQLAQLAAAATDGSPENEQTVALAAKNASSVISALSKISAKTQRLARIIDNLLKLVNNDQFTTRMNKQPVDMRALILQVTADHRPFIGERKLQLIVDVAENLPPLEGDRDKLEDALTNLISNAIRFSPDGTTVRVAAHEVMGEMLEILVEDSGPGIPQEDLANLFEPFYTGSDILHHHSGTFEYGSKGLGLGLAIVRRFIELHGGIVRAHAIRKDGKTTGTQFQILLPLMKNADTDSLVAGGTTPAGLPAAEGGAKQNGGQEQAGTGDGAGGK